MAKIDDEISKAESELWKKQKEAIDVARKRLALMDLEFTEVSYPDKPNQMYLDNQAELIFEQITGAFNIRGM